MLYVLEFIRYRTKWTGFGCSVRICNLATWLFVPESLTILYIKKTWLEINVILNDCRDLIHTLPGYCPDRAVVSLTDRGTLYYTMTNTPWLTEKKIPSIPFRKMFLIIFRTVVSIYLTHLEVSGYSSTLEADVNCSKYALYLVVGRLFKSRWTFILKRPIEGIVWTWEMFAKLNRINAKYGFCFTRLQSWQ